VVSVPRLVIAAPASGSGKTTIATGLVAAFAARGTRVAPFKVGPDYIDPGYAALATGLGRQPARVGRNLDPFLVGEQRIAPLFAAGSAGADIAIVEGVMGLFDGRGASDEASTAHVARLLDAPVLLVVDATGQSRSIAALVSGFAAFDRRIRIGGVLLNRVGSARHEALLREALAAVGVPVVGALHRDDAIETPSRHLGLVPVAERSSEARGTVARLGDLVARSVDLDAVAALARSAPQVTAAPWAAEDEVGPPVTGRPRIAIAGGSAFTFSYAEHAELLTAAGAEVVSVDPLVDEALPPGTRGLVIGGGFPEIYAEQLSSNERLRASVAALAASGAPIAAECAGLLYLARDLDGLPMCGVLPTSAHMTSRLTLGYREADGLGWPLADQPVRGHEFHRTATDPGAGATPAYCVQDRPEGFVQGRVHASYLHLHWAGVPSMARALTQATTEVAACA
jgi:cobyrinic acid a,c-diamide synthase